MNFLNLFDEYDIKARLAPAVVVVAPLIGILSCQFPSVFNSALFMLGSGIIVLALLFLVSHIVRALGAQLEAELWTEWGGPPSTRILRWRDDTMSGRTKEMIGNAVLKIYGRNIPTSERELNDPMG